MMTSNPIQSNPILDADGLMYSQFLVAKHIHIPKKGDLSDPELAIDNIT